MIQHSDNPFDKVQTVRLLTGFLLLATISASAQTVFNVKEYGAAGDGRTLDTVAIGKAIHAANAAGGGTVLFPPGKYLSGTFELLSNVTLNLDPGSIIQGSGNVADYGATGDFGLARNYGVDSSGEGLKVGLIVARNARNVSIIGRGVIDGNGDSFFDLSKPHNTRDFDPVYTRQGDAFDDPKLGWQYGPVDTKEAGRAGTMIIFFNCKNILLRDITLSNAPNWTLHLQSSENAVITGLHIMNDLLLPNNDGLDCMRCKNVHISDCDILAGDDDFAIVGSENVQVANCSLTSYSAAVRLEDSHYVTFDNLSIHANRGLAIFSRGQEHTAHVLFSNIVFETQLITGHWWGKAEPIYIASRGGQGQSEISDVQFINMTGEAEGGMMIYGSPDSAIRDISLDNVKLRIRAPQARNSQSVGGNFDLRWTATNFGEAIFKHDIPALYARYVNGLRIRGFQLSWGDGLPSYFSNAIEAEDFGNLDFADFKGGPAPVSPSAPAVVLRNGKDVRIRDSLSDKGAKLSVSATDVTGDRSF